jgi:hypothetical protein
MILVICRVARMYSTCIYCSEHKHITKIHSVEIWHESQECDEYDITMQSTYTCPTLQHFYRN